MRFLTRDYGLPVETINFKSLTQIEAAVCYVLREQMIIYLGKGGGNEEK